MKVAAPGEAKIRDKIACHIVLPASEGFATRIGLNDDVGQHKE